MENALETVRAAELFQEAAEEGSSGSDVAERAHRIADDIRHEQQEVSPYGPNLDAENVAKTLDATANKVKQILGGTSTGDLEPGVAGVAYQGQDGSSQIDIVASMHASSSGPVVNYVQLVDTVAHERRHEEQSAAWNAEEVDIGNGEKVTRTQVSEADAMSVQSTIEWVSEEYKKIYSFIFGISSREHVRETAMNGDLRGFANAIRASRGLPSLEEMEAGEPVHALAA